VCAETPTAAPVAAEGTARRILTPDQRLRVFISSTLQELAPQRLGTPDKLLGQPHGVPRSGSDEGRGVETSGCEIRVSARCRRRRTLASSREESGRSGPSERDASFTSDAIRG
jgi:hypothetical protein